MLGLNIPNPSPGNQTPQPSASEVKLWGYLHQDQQDEYILIPAAQLLCSIYARSIKLLRCVICFFVFLTAKKHSSANKTRTKRAKVNEKKSQSPLAGLAILPIARLAGSNERQFGKWLGTPGWKVSQVVKGLQDVNYGAGPRPRAGKTDRRTDSSTRPHSLPPPRRRGHRPAASH